MLKLIREARQDKTSRTRQDKKAQTGQDKKAQTGQARKDERACILVLVTILGEKVK